MTRDDIIRMVREAGVLSGYEAELFQKFAALVAEAEREECAKVCEEDAFVEQWKGLAEAVRRIRARGAT